MDQATVLEEVVKYIKHLQEKVKTLEGQSSETTTDAETGTCSNDENFTNEPQPLPQIEAKVSEKNVLIRILSVNRKGVLVKVIKEIEKLNLRVVNSNVTSFGTSTLAISLVAQMEGESILSVKDLVKSLRSSLIQFTGENFPQEPEN